MNENAARLDWAGAGVRLPWRFVKPRPLRLAVERTLGDPAIKARTDDLAAWDTANDPGTAAAALVERLARREPIGAAHPVSSALAYGEGGESREASRTIPQI
jgi:UDP:flavonoid glycosyltransferase YjiC (YdhE family)